MKHVIYLLVLLLSGSSAMAQLSIEDKAMRYQQERMVYKQWDRSKFEPTSGFLGLNPYYWLTWGLHPNYPDTDRRPLSAWGPQTQRLGLVGVMNSTSNAYKLEADTLRNTSLLEISNYSGALSAADPLWLMYYSKELKPAIEYSESSILSALPAGVRLKVLQEGMLGWYKNELDILKERITAARSADMDRGSRILAYHRLLSEYRQLTATWATRVSTAEKNGKLSQTTQKVKSSEQPVASWSEGADEQIAKDILRSRKY